MHLFHCPLLDGDLVDLPEEEAHHAVHVLRLKVGDRIGLLNGAGMRVVAQLAVVDKRRVTAEVIERHQHAPERTARIHLCVAPTKQQERLEWLVEKAVEVGVDRITPLITERTERNRLRMDRLQRVAVAAMKQSQRTWAPQLDEPMGIPALLATPLPEQRFFGWCAGGHSPLMQAYDARSDALVLIGPEGDFSDGEAALLKQAGFLPVSIGHARLRTETAALAAITWMSLAQQR